MIDHTCGGENDSDQDQSRNDNGYQIDEEIRLPWRASSAPGLQRSQGLTMDNGDAPSHKSVEDQVWPLLNYILYLRQSGVASLSSKDRLWKYKS